VITIRKDHPRILASDEDFEKIASIGRDELGAAYLNFLRKSGEALLEVPPPQYNIVGVRLLEQSRLALKQLLTFALLYRLDGDKRYHEKVAALLEHIIGFPDWNPQHYLDVGEMTLAVSIGLDWIWDEIPDALREQGINAILTKGIEPSLDEDNPANWWIAGSNNWNPVCHAGLVSGAILIADCDPELAEFIINRAVDSIPHALAETDPDGIYPEGPTYWDYGTSFTAILITLLDCAAGHHFGLADHESLRKSILFRAMTITPTGLFYNFYDSGGRPGFTPTPAWFAGTYDEPVAHYEYRRTLKDFLVSEKWEAGNSDHRLLPLLALWYPEIDRTGDPDSTDLPQVWHGRGDNPMVLIRERGEDPEAFYLGFKGGFGRISHAHMDAGSFIFEDKGVRWAMDLGSQDYHSLESRGIGIWDRRQASDRWRIFRIGPYSHNLLLIDEQPHHVDQKASISGFEKYGNTISGSVELTAVNQDRVESYRRQFTVHDFTVVRIEDIIRGVRKPSSHEGRNSATLHWRMVTEAAVDIQGNLAILSQEGKRLFLKVLLPEGVPFQFHARPLDPPPYFYDAPNPGMSSIDIWFKADDAGNQNLTVLMSTDYNALDREVSSVGNHSSYENSPVSKD